MTMERTGISVHQIDYEYSALEVSGKGGVFCSFSVDFFSGAIAAVMGPSGCGKTTLLKLLCGIIKPQAGVIDIIGRKPGAYAVAFVPQGVALMPWLTVKENVELSTKFMAISGAGSRRSSIDVLGRYGLADYASALPAELSGGMRQRVALARALAMESPLVLLDEPFSQSDVTMRQTLKKDVRELHKEMPGRVTILVTHSITDVVDVADEVIVLGGRPCRVIDRVQIAPAQFESPRSKGGQREMALSKLAQALGASDAI